MTHYEQRCAQACPHCRNHSIPEYYKFGDGPLKVGPTTPEYYSLGYGPLHRINGDWVPCTAPTLAEFAERCAKALTELVDLFDVAKDSGGFNTLAYEYQAGDFKLYEAARRALGLEK